MEQENILRETKWFKAVESKRGVRITAKEKGALPKTAVVPLRLWKQLVNLHDSEFDGSVVLEIGIGTFCK